MGHNSVVSGHPKSTGILWVDGLSMGPPDLGCHTYALHLCTGHHVESSVSAWLGSTLCLVFDHGKSTLCLVFNGGIGILDYIQWIFMDAFQLF